LGFVPHIHCEKRKGKGKKRKRRIALVQRKKEKKKGASASPQFAMLPIREKEGEKGRKGERRGKKNRSANDRQTEVVRGGGSRNKLVFLYLEGEEREGEKGNVRSQHTQKGKKVSRIDCLVCVPNRKKKKKKGGGKKGDKKTYRMGKKRER